MPCIKPDGTLSRVGIVMLEAVRQSATEEEVCRASGLPLFRTRSALRGLRRAGLVRQEGDRYVATPGGLGKLNRHLLSS